MNDAAAMARLTPHAGAMVLLKRVESWDADSILCFARSHLDPANPLRRHGCLAAVAGIEYGLQAAAVHGALTAGGVAQRPGHLAGLRDVALLTDRLDDPSLGDLRIAARLERLEARGLIYRFEVRAEAGRPLLSGRAVIALPPPS